VAVEQMQALAYDYNHDDVVTSEYRKKKLKKAYHQTHPAFAVRLFSSGIDVVFSGWPLWLFPSTETARIEVLFACIAGYYLATEFFLGRTLGKMIFGLYMLGSRGEELANQAQRGFRLVLRLLLGPFCLLCWHRVTLLDLMSGTRIYSTRTPSLAVQKKMNGLPQPLGWR
jgi:uncharacterized RDD family membrane protein YckC